jgi:hypothetical protein
MAAIWVLVNAFTWAVVMALKSLEAKFLIWSVFNLEMAVGLNELMIDMVAPGIGLGEKRVQSAAVSCLRSIRSVTESVLPSLSLVRSQNFFWAGGNVLPHGKYIPLNDEFQSSLYWLENCLKKKATLLFLAHERSNRTDFWPIRRLGKPSLGGIDAPCRSAALAVQA